MLYERGRCGDITIGTVVALILERLLVRFPANVEKLDFLRECRLYSVAIERPAVTIRFRRKQVNELAHEEKAV